MDNNNKETKNQIVNIIFAVYDRNKTEDILNELSLLRSRLSIINLHEIFNLSKLDQEKYILGLIEDEVNQTTQLFVKRIIVLDLLKEILGSNFDLFLDDFEKQSKTKADILFISAIDISPNLQKKVSELLRNKYPDTLRTVFLKDSELIAGFKVIMLEKEFDYSLKNCGPKLIDHKIKGRI